MKERRRTTAKNVKKEDFSVDYDEIHDDNVWDTENTGIVTTYNSTGETTTSAIEGFFKFEDVRTVSNTEQRVVKNAVVFSLASKYEMHALIRFFRGWRDLEKEDLQLPKNGDSPISKSISNGKMSIIKTIDKNLEKLSKIRFKDVSKYNSLRVFTHNRPYVVIDSYSLEIINILYKQDNLVGILSLGYFLDNLKKSVIINTGVQINKLIYIGHIEDALLVISESAGIAAESIFNHNEVEQQKPKGSSEKYISVDGKKYPVTIIEEIIEGNIDDFYSALEGEEVSDA